MEKILGLKREQEVRPTRPETASTPKVTVDVHGTSKLDSPLYQTPSKASANSNLHTTSEVEITQHNPLTPPPTFMKGYSKSPFDAKKRQRRDGDG